MAIDRRVLIPAFLIVSAASVTLYAVAAHDLAKWGWTCRGTLGDATFLPFPTGPRGVLMDVVAKMSPADEFIYTYLIKTGALVSIFLLLWILAAAYLLKAVLPLFWKPSSHIPVNLLCFQRALVLGLVARITCLVMDTNYSTTYWALPSFSFTF